MRREPRTYRPQLDALESRLQPGSVLAGVFDLPLVADFGTVAVLSGSEKADHSPVQAPQSTTASPTVVAAPLEAADFANPIADVLPAPGSAITPPGQERLERIQSNPPAMKSGPGGGSVTAAQLIENGGFESGDLLPGWAVLDPTNEEIGVDDFHPRTGTYGAYLGTIPVAGNGLYQVVVYPTGVQQCSLEYWLANGEGAENYWIDLVIEIDGSGGVAGTPFNFNALANAAASPHTRYMGNYTPNTGAVFALVLFYQYNAPDYWDLDDVSLNCT